MNDVEKTLIVFLQESSDLIEHLNDIDEITARELYAMLKMCAHISCENINVIDSNLRVEICDKLDMVLERIIDLNDNPVSVSANIYTPAIHNFRTWKNVELMKDKGLVGYMLAKETGAQPFMFFCSKEEDYLYQKDLSGLNLIFEDTDYNDSTTKQLKYFKFLRKNYNDIDVLILHGVYNETIKFLEEYRKLRPDGIVFCGLDMSSTWMNAYNWNNAFTHNFFAQCNIVATSCKFIRDELNKNKNINFPCRYYPNAFYNPHCAKPVADYSVKENVILTVGRIGTMQKNNEELMIAFASVANIIHDWKLKLVGDVAPEFRPFIDSFFTTYPELRQRIIFTGKINDKDNLYKEYAKAKIFALSSKVEGGTPNVYAEALHHGCMFVTSDIDAASDITKGGELGQTYKIGDVNALSQALLNMCSHADENAFEKHIPKAVAYAEKYFNWERNSKKLAFALFN